MSTEIYTLVSPTRSFSLAITPWTPIRSMSLALMVSKPQRMSFLISPLRLINGARIPAWIDVFRIQPSSWAMWRKVPRDAFESRLHREN